MERDGGVGTRRGGDKEQKAEQDSPKAHPIGSAHRAVAWSARRTATLDLDLPRASAIGDLTPNRHRAPRGRRRGRSLTGALR
jgi:hypothetical protein